MILESVFSCSYLFLVCGACMYKLGKESYDRYDKLLPQFMWAFIGITSTAARSFTVLLYKLFYKTYTFDPAFIEIEEEKDKTRLNILDHFLGSLSAASFSYSLCYHHGYYTFGACFVASLSLCSMLILCCPNVSTQQQEDISPRFCTILSRIHILIDPEYTILFWILFNGCFSYAVNNNYGLVANYPHLITAWAYPTEGFYQGWTIRRTINDYMMTAYVILMIEALRQTKTM